MPIRTMDKKIIFFGGVGSSTTFGGELTKNKEIIARLKELGCDVTLIDSFQSRKNPLKLLKLLLRFLSCILLYSQATFIFSTSFGNIYPLFKVLSRLPLKLHIVYWVIGGAFAERVVKGEFQRKYLEIVDLFIVEGYKMKKQMAGLGFDNTIYKPNFKKVGTLPKIKKADDGKIHFLFISRIVLDKGCRYIMQCVSDLNQKGLANKYVVDFYGNIENGAYRQEFEREVAAIANVNYCGTLQLRDERNYEILARYHYMLFPTYWKGEGFPGVVIDAYKAGVPIIASDWNLNSESIKKGVTGILIPTHSAVKLCEAMEGAISGKFDNAALSANCQEEVWRFDTRRVINEKLVEMIINIRRRKSLISQGSEAW